MRACRTARRGIFRFKLRYCDRGILRSRLLKALAARGFHEDGCGVEFALQRKFNPAARRFLLCSVKFAPLRNDKIYGALASRRGLLCMQVLRCVCFAGKVLRRAINLKCERSQIAGVWLNLKRAIGQISGGAAGFLKFMDKILRCEISLREILAAIVSRL